MGEGGHWGRALRLSTCSLFLFTFCFFSVGALWTPSLLALGLLYELPCLPHRKDCTPLEDISQSKPSEGHARGVY